MNVNDIYDKFENSDFMFEYDGDCLSDSEIIFEDELSSIQDKKKNFDSIPLIVKCTTCNELMNYKNKSGIVMEGYYKCSICKCKLDEEELYLKLNDENDEGLNYFY